mgnify:CR=1 FL=1
MYANGILSNINVIVGNGQAEVTLPNKELFHNGYNRM